MAINMKVIEELAAGHKKLVDEMKGFMQGLTRKNSNPCPHCGNELVQNRTEPIKPDGTKVFYFKCKKCNKSTHKTAHSPGKKLTIYDWDGKLAALCNKVLAKYEDTNYVEGSSAIILQVIEKLREKNDGILGLFSQAQVVKRHIPNISEVDQDKLNEIDDEMNMCIYDALSEEEMYDLMREVIYQSIGRFENLVPEANDSDSAHSIVKFNILLREYLVQSSKHNLKMLKMFMMAHRKLSKSHANGKTTNNTNTYPLTDNIGCKNSHSVAETAKNEKGVKKMRSKSTKKTQTSSEKKMPKGK